MDIQDWLREDFRVRVSEIEARLESRQSVVHYGLIALAGITALVAAAYAKDVPLGKLLGEWLCTVNLAVAFFFLVFCLMLLRHDLFIAYNAQYIETHIKPKIAGLPSDLLTWEKYVCSKRAKYGVTHKILALSRIAPMALPYLAFMGLGALTLYILASGLLYGKYDGLNIAYLHWGGFSEPRNLAFFLWAVITGVLGLINFIGLFWLFRTGWLVWQEEREIASVAEGEHLQTEVAQSLGSSREVLEPRIDDLEKRVARLEEEMTEK